MFTGIITATGRIARVTPLDSGARLEVSARGLVLRTGESVAVDGACLTAVAPVRGRFAAVLSRETLARTTLGERRPGDRVNLERSLRASDRLGGHFVLGHVDTRAKVLGLEPEGTGARLVVALPRGYDSVVVDKGSLAVNGVSLTVARVRAGAFEVALIPYTLRHTNLGELGRSDIVNLELDYLAKLVVGVARNLQSGRRRRR